jgi:hypothetical protein
MDARDVRFQYHWLDGASDRLGVESRPARIVNEKSALGPPCQLDTRAGWAAFGVDRTNAEGPTIDAKAELGDAIASLEHHGVARKSLQGDWKYAQPRA